MSTWPASQVTQIAEMLRFKVRENFLTHGRLSSISFLFATRNPTSGTKEPQILMVPPAPGSSFDENERELYSRQLRQLCRETGAQGIVWVSEMWMVRREVGQSMPSGSLEHVPDREEAIYFTLEHLELGEQAWCAKIQREGEAVRLLDWEELPKAQRGGRFAGLLRANQN